MRNAIIAALVAAIAIGGALGVFAATQTIETTATVEVRVWQRISDGALFLSTRPQGGEWDTGETALKMNQLNNTGQFQISSIQTVEVPVEVEVEVPEGAAEVTPTPHAAPAVLPSETLVAGPCCEVLGMEGATTIREQIVEDMQDVVEFGLKTYDITHSGNITLNIAFSNSGLLVRYEDAFGERPDELPDACSFQEGEHMFFGSTCRSDKGALSSEWFERALGAGEVEPRWVGHGVRDYFVSHYAEGEVPVVSEDRFRRVMFYERSRDIRRDQASDDMMTLVMLYALADYGDFSDWLRFYGSTRAGLDAATAFESAFEAPLSEFYDDFEAWVDQQRLILIATAFPSCRAAAENIQQQPGSVGLGFGYPDYRVPLEVDGDEDGVVCEGFALPISSLTQ